MTRALLNYKVRIEQMENKRPGLVSTGERICVPKIGVDGMCVEEDSGVRYLVMLNEKCNLTIVDAMNLLVHAWNKRH
ncbi:hypothetical protein FHG87_013400 [Trinorchestia longiramus]|nr:hypothetical protein FHG87_013400 [Trinorchestia longiramus]